MTVIRKNCLTCERPESVKLVDGAFEFFIARTEAGELFGTIESTCRDDCRLGGWVLSRKRQDWLVDLVAKVQGVTLSDWY